MSKKATVNSFTGGLSLDLNPLTNTKDVLTDALNATLVTGNGDEMILQNAMGNTPKGNIPDGYIPLGCTEYGGVAYMALYNPTTRKCQLGTYPSPEQYEVDKSTSSNITSYPFAEANDIIEIQLSKDIVENVTYGAKITFEVTEDFLKYINISDTTQNIWDLQWVIILDTGREIEVYPTYKDRIFTINYDNIDGDLVLRLKRRGITKFEHTTYFIKKEDVSTLQYVPEDIQGIINKIPDGGGVFIFSSAYWWKCPDGISETTPSNVINGIAYTIDINGVSNTYYYNHASDQHRIITAENDYKRKVLTYQYISTVTDTDKYTTTVYPIVYNKEQIQYSHVNTFLGKDSTTSDIYINTWNYTISNTEVTLNWGIYVKNLFNNNIKNIQISFEDIDGSKLLLPLMYLSGEFSTTGINTESLHISPNRIYLATIVITLDDGSSYSDYRWINTSGIYNNCTLKDFGDENIIDYNNLNLDVDLNSPNFTTVTTQKSLNLLSNTKSDTVKGNIVNTINSYYNIDRISTAIGMFNIDLNPLQDTMLSYQVDSVNNKELGTDAIKVVGDNGDTTNYVQNNQKNYDKLTVKFVTTSSDFTLQNIKSNSKYLKISFNTVQSLYGKSKLLSTPTTFTQYFRPFLIDPQKVTAKLCSQLKSNYYAFGYELYSDYLPQIYFETQAETNTNGKIIFQPYIVNRKNIVSGYHIDLENSTLKLYDNSDNAMASASDFSKYTEIDDSPARTTDVGIIYTPLNDTIYNTHIKEIASDTSLIDTYEKALNATTAISIYGDFSNVTIANSSSDLKKDMWVSAFGNSYAQQMLESINSNSVQNTCINVTDARQINTNQIYSLDIFTLNSLASTYTTSIHNRFIPTFNFWGSAYLTDMIGVDKTNKYVQLNNATASSQTNGFGNSTYRNSGIALGKLKIVYNSVNISYPVGTPYKSLVPFWLDTQCVYSSINMAVSEEINSLDKQDTPQTLRSLDMGGIIRSLVNEFSNYYLYTKGSITVDNPNIYMLDINNVSYTKSITNDLGLKGFHILLSNSLLEYGNQNYQQLVNNLLDSTFKTTQAKKVFKPISKTRSSSNKKDQLSKTSQFTVVTNSNIEYSYTVKDMENTLNGIRDTEKIDYPVLLSPSTDEDTWVNIKGNTKSTEPVTNKVWKYKSNSLNVITQDSANNALDINKYYILKDGVQSQDNNLDSEFVLTNITLSDTEAFSTLLLNSKNTTLNIPDNVVRNDILGLSDCSNISAIRNLKQVLVLNPSFQFSGLFQGTYEYTQGETPVYKFFTFGNIPINTILQKNHANLYENVKYISK